MGVNTHTAFHDLFHASSRHIVNKRYFYGFKLPNGFGIMLNECYTNHLTIKYFRRYNWNK